MTIQAHKLVRMGEHITANLAYTDDQQVVATKVADHLGRFWDSRMLKTLEDHRQSHPDALSPALNAAMQILVSSTA